MAWPEHPLVSALMIVDRPALVPVAQEAARCLSQQTWPVKELVVFNATGQALRSWRNRRWLRELRLCRRSREGMLDILKENAHGQWCVLWDADCWYAPTVIAEHMAVRDPETAILFRNKLCYSLALQQAVAIDDQRVLHGSWHRLSAMRPEAECPFYRQTTHSRLMDNSGQLLIKFVNAFIH